MTHIILQKQPRSFSNQRNGMFFKGQFSHLISTKKSFFFFLVMKGQTECRKNHKQAAAWEETQH